MNSRVDLYAIEPVILVATVTNFRCLRLAQLQRMYQGKEEILDRLLDYFRSTGRLVVDRAQGLVACNEDWAKRGHPHNELALWSVLDFLDKVEEILPGTDLVTLTAFGKEGSEYDFIAVLPGQEALTAARLNAQRAALSDHVILVLQDTAQITPLSGCDVTAYCVVDPDGTTHYYTHDTHEEDV